MQSILSGDAEIFYEVAGSGPPILLLHPFPLHHQFWLPVAQSLSTRYQLIMPDLRGHGESALGDGPATMAKHADDLRRLLDEAGVTRAPMVGVSIGGYIIFEFWRRFRERVRGLVLSNTKAGADSPEARSTRLRSAEEVLERGTEPFFEGMLQKAPAETTRRSRPDVIEAALGMMRKMSPDDVAGVQRGMAERPDSIPILGTINVPALILTGDEDVLTGVREAEGMKENIAGAQMKVISKAGHYAPFEQPQEVGRVLRQFLDSLYA